MASVFEVFRSTYGKTRQCVEVTKVSATIDAAIVHVHNFFAQGVEERLREEEDADLAEATDRYDLEFRMRKQDRLRGGSYWSNGNNR